MAFTSCQQVLASALLLAQAISTLVISLFLSAPYGVISIIKLTLDNSPHFNYSHFYDFSITFLLLRDQKAPPLTPNNQKTWRKDRVRVEIYFSWEDKRFGLICKTCEIPINEQTKHCKLCNMCIEGFDHHCVWLNRCIG